MLAQLYWKGKNDGANSTLRGTSKHSEPHFLPEFWNPTDCLLSRSGASEWTGNVHAEARVEDGGVGLLRCQVSVSGGQLLTTSQLILFILLPSYLLLFSAGYLVARWNRGHEIVTLGLGPKILVPSLGYYVEEIRALLGSLVFIILLPLLPIILLLSIPYFKIVGLRQRRREAEFVEGMRHSGRVISWAEAEQHAIAKEGTLISELLFIRPSRLWWTPEILADQTSFTYFRPGDKDRTPFDKEFEAFGKWCFESYTNPESGSAVLVDIPKGSRRLFWKQFKSAGYECITTHYRDKREEAPRKNTEQTAGEKT
jgi:hypothetical protein